MKRSPSLYPHLVTVACLVVVVAGMRASRSLLVPFLLAAFLAVTLTPVQHWLQRKGVRTSLALLIILAGITLLGSGLLLLVGKSFNDFSEKLPSYQEALTSHAEPWVDWLNGYGIELPQSAPSEARAEPDHAALADQTALEFVGEAARAGSERATPPPAEEAETTAADRPPIVPFPFDRVSLMSLGTSMLSSLSELFSNGLIIFITVTFMLLEASQLPAKLAAAFDKTGDTRRQIEVIVGNVRRYVAIKTATSLLTGVLVASALMFLRVDYALLWGLLAFLFNFVPNIGSIIAAVPAVALAYLQAGVPTAFVAAIAYLLVNCFISYAIEPRFMGQGLGLSTLVVFLSLVFWGWVLGPVGMLLSAPLTMILKISLDADNDTRWVAVLLSSKPPE